MSKASHPCWLSPPELGRLLHIKPERGIALIRAGRLPALNVASVGSKRPRYRLRLRDVEEALAVKIERRLQRRQDGRAKITEYF